GGGLARPDSRLDIPWAKRRIRLDFQLPEPHPIAANRSLELLIEWQGGLTAGWGPKQQPHAFVDGRDQTQLLHYTPPRRLGGRHQVWPLGRPNSGTAGAPRAAPFTRSGA